MKVIEIENIGAISHLRIPICEQGGVTVLRGANGCGKSTALEAARALMAGKGQLPVRDACTAGHVNGLGVTIRVGKTTRRAGELEVIHLEDRLSIADLVDPGLKSEDAADGRRIKALVGLTGAKADPLLFPAEARNGLELIDDLVEQAAHAKRNLETLARAEERRADELAAKARAMREGIPEDAPMMSEGDVKLLRDKVTTAHRDEATIRERYDQASRREVEAAQARQQLQRLAEGFTGPSPDDAELAEREAKAAVDATQLEVSGITATLQAAQAKLAEERHELSMAIQANESVREHRKALAALAATIESVGTGPAADEATVNVAQEATAQAETALTEGLLALGFADKLRKACVVADESIDAQAKAQTLREAAKRIDDVLAEAIACPVLQVEAGRLVTKTVRGRTLFAELSEGERWRIALDIAADQVGDGGIITVPQSAWEGLDAVNRRAIAEHVKSRRVTLLTAEAQRGGEPEELTAAALGEL